MAPILTKHVVEEVVRRLDESGELAWPSGTDENKEVQALAAKLQPKYGRWLAKSPSLEDVTHLSQEVATTLAEIGAVRDPVEALQLKQSLAKSITSTVSQFFSGSSTKNGRANDAGVAAWSFVDGFRLEDERILDEALTL